MDSSEPLAACFEADHEHLRSVAFRILGSLDDAEDAIQQTWIKLSQAGRDDIQNMTGWLTTVIARECLDVLRARKRRGEVALPDDETASGPVPPVRSVEEEVLLADSVGRALLVVLDRLTSTERVALVLHDMFAIPFEEVANILDRSPTAAKKLASRARHKVRGDTTKLPPRLRQQQQLASAFLSASRTGDVNELLAVLAPDVIRRAETAALPAGAATEIRGVKAVAEEIAVNGPQAAGAELALIDGNVGIVVTEGSAPAAPYPHIQRRPNQAFGVIAGPSRLDHLSITLLEYPYVATRTDLSPDMPTTDGHRVEISPLAQW